MSKILLLPIFFALNSCLSFNTPFPLAQTVSEGQSLRAVSYNYINAQESSTLRKRLGGNFASDLNHTVPFYNFSYEQRTGLSPYSDAGFTLSFFNIGLDLKYKFYHVGFLHAATSLMLTSEIFSPDPQIQPTLHLSYEIAANLQAYINSKLFIPLSPQGIQPGFTSGFLYGKQNAVGFEYGYFASTQSKAPVYEQLRFSYVHDLNTLKERREDDKSDILFQATVYPPGIGLIKEYGSWQGFASGAQRNFWNERGYSGLHSQLNLGLRFLSDYSGALAIGAWDDYYHIKTDGLWEQSNIRRIMAETGFYTEFAQWRIFWAKIAYPLFFLKAQNVAVVNSLKYNVSFDFLQAQGTF